MSNFEALYTYQSANAALGVPTPGEQRVVFIGDSITELWNLTSYFGKGYVNRGLSGQTTGQVLLRFRQDVIGIGATHALILAGINDIGAMAGYEPEQEIIGNLLTMCEMAAVHEIKPILATLLPTSNYHAQTPPRTTTHPLSRITAINSLIKVSGWQVLDYYTALLDGAGFLRSDCSSDDLHPNALGYSLMSPLAEVAINHASGEG